MVTMVYHGICSIVFIQKNMVTFLRDLYLCIAYFFFVLFLEL